MSWVENIKNNIIVVTGDGKKWEPLYLILPRSIEYNVAEFEFIGVDGTLVKKSRPKGTRHSFEFIFQDEEHLEIAKDFEQSAKDERPWKITHPLYDALLVQPLNLKIDPTGLNTTIISGEYVETIQDEYPFVSVDPSQKADFDADNTAIENASSLANGVDPSPSDVSSMGNDSESVYAIGATAVKIGEQSNGYFAQFQKTQSAILNAATDMSLTATEINNLLIYPYLFSDTVKNRLSLLASQYAALFAGIGNIITPNQKKIFEAQGSAIVVGMIKTVLSPITGDYTSSTAVINVIGQLTGYYNNFISAINSLQTPNGYGPASYIPNFNTINQLSNVVNYTVSQLFVIALGAKKERELILEADSNPIILAHRFYGLDVSDENLSNFMDQNNMGISETLQVLKGRRIIYYI